MGNCINRSSSAGAARDVVKPRGSSPCDERTIESSSNATASPPSSPSPLSKANAVCAVTAESRDDGVPAANDACRDDAAATPQTFDESASIVERKREEGQERLRNLVVSGARSGDIDWKSIIALAEDLHRREQQLLRSYGERRFGGRNKNHAISSSGGGGSGNNISRGQAFFERRRRRREMSRRRKLESVGSFSVNLYLYKDEDVCRSLHSSFNENATDDPDDVVDVFEDDDPPPPFRDTSRANYPTRATTGAGGPNAPATGSFMDAVSLYDSTEDDESSSSDSSTSGPPEENWDLMTIDENATVTDW